jgi:hypothetical protein
MDNLARKKKWADDDEKPEACPANDVESVEEEGQVELQEDVYSLMFTEGFGAVWLYSFFVVMMQLAIICLFYWDLLKDGKKGNHFNLPINVATQVTTAQFMAMPLAVMVHGDCTEAIYLLSRRYDPKILETYPDATGSSWRMALCLRFMVGFLLIVISFIQIMQATRLTELFLNLEAIVFVGELDNFAFWLAQKGFLKQEFQEATEKVEGVKMRAAPHGWGRTIIRRVVMLLTWGILVAGWVYVLMTQWNGGYLKAAACQSLTITFGDDVLSLDRALIQTSNTIRDYYEVRGGAGANLKYSYFSGSYAPALKGNGLEIDAVTEAFERNEEGEDCAGWLLRSPATTAFVLEEVPTDGWRVWIGDSKNGSVSDVSGFNIRCDDCKKPVDCNYHGTCSKDTSTCSCLPSYFGSRCEFDLPCPAMEIDFLGASSTDYYKEGPYSVLRRDKTLASLDTKTSKEDLLLVYGRPVYAWTEGVEEYTFYENDIEERE